MDAVTGVMFTDEERYILERVMPFIGMPAPDGPPDDRHRHRGEIERHWRHVCQRREVIQRVSIARSLSALQECIAELVETTDEAYWCGEWRKDFPKAAADQFPQRMVDYIIGNRKAMLPLAIDAELILKEAFMVATDKPDDEKYEGL